MTTITNQEKTLSREDVRVLVKEELKSLRFEDRLNKVLESLALEQKVCQLVQQQKSTLDNHIKVVAQEKTETHLERHLSGAVRPIVDSIMQIQLPLIIKASIITHLSKLSGVNDLLDEHKVAIEEKLEQYRRDLSQMLENNNRALAVTADSCLSSFSDRARHESNILVATLVANNGSVIQGFKDELKTTNARDIENHKNENRRKLKELESKLNVSFWWNMGLTFGIAVLLVKQFSN